MGARVRGTIGALGVSALVAGCGNGGVGAAARGEAALGDAGEAVPAGASCPPAGSRAAAPRVERDVTYATTGGRPLRLDLARPAADGARPLVVLLHGGGWEGGSRTAMHDEMLALAAHGYVAATVEYRLTQRGTNVFPAAVQDVRCAVRWLRARADRYGIDPARVAAGGFSAGGHLASMLAVADEGAFDDPAPDLACDAGAPGTSARVSAALSAAGPQDLRVRGSYTQEQARLVTNFLGVFPGDAPALAARASPLAHVGAGDAPMLLVHGTADGLVPVAHSRWMRDALRAAGTPATLVELRGEGHTFDGFASSGRAAVRCASLAFLERWLGR